MGVESGSGGAEEDVESVFEVEERLIKSAPEMWKRSEITIEERTTQSAPQLTLKRVKRSTKLDKETIGSEKDLQISDRLNEIISESAPQLGKSPEDVEFDMFLSSSAPMVGVRRSKVSVKDSSDRGQSQLEQIGEVAEDVEQVKHESWDADLSNQGEVTGEKRK